MVYTWRIYAYTYKRHWCILRGRNSRYNWTSQRVLRAWRWCRWPDLARNRQPECWWPDRRIAAPKIIGPHRRTSRQMPTPRWRKSWTADGRYAVAVGAAKRRTRAPTVCDDVALAPGSRVSRLADAAADAWWCARRRDDRSDTGRNSPPAGVQSCSRASPDRSQIGANRSFFRRSRQTIKGFRGSLSSLGLIECRPGRFCPLTTKGSGAVSIARSTVESPFASTTSSSFLDRSIDRSLRWSHLANYVIWQTLWLTAGLEVVWSKR